MADARLHRPSPKPLEMRIVAVENGRAVRRQPINISALASAIASTDGKFSRCTASTVVIAQTCGRSWRPSRAISPAWFIPISNTANRAPGARRARLSGTPQ